MDTRPNTTPETDSLKRQIEAYETVYGLSSENFLKCYRNGWLPQKPEFDEWAALLVAYQHARGEG